MKTDGRRSILLTALRFILVVVTLVSAVLQLLGYCAWFVDPNSIVWLAFLGLGLQFLMLWNFVLLLVWLVWLSWWAAVPGFVLLIGIGFVGDFVQMSWVKHYQHGDYSGESTLTVATYNVHNFGEISDPGRSAAIKDSILANLGVYQPDVICFQEYAHNLNRDTLKFDKMHAEYPHRQSFITTNWGQVKLSLELYSRYPLRGVMNKQYSGTDNAMQVVDVIVSRNCVVRLFNCHLQTTEFNMIQPDGLLSLVEKSDTAAVTSVIKGLKRNFIKRAQQADTVAKYIAESPHMVIVAGDFNDTPASYALGAVGNGLDDGFCKAAAGYGSTYRKMRGLFRIDYVLYNGDSLSAVKYDSPDLEWSDHRPVITKLIFNKR